MRACEEYVFADKCGNGEDKRRDGGGEYAWKGKNKTGLSEAGDG